MWLVYQLSRGEGPEKKTLRDKSRISPAVPFGPVTPERAAKLLESYAGKIVECVGPDDATPVKPPAEKPPQEAAPPAVPVHLRATRPSVDVFAGPMPADAGAPTSEPIATLELPTDLVVVQKPTAAAPKPAANPPAPAPKPEPEPSVKEEV